MPFVSATDETGGLARSIDVLKQGAAAMDEQRWVKSNVSRLTGRVAGRGVACRVRPAAAVGPRADARRRRRGLLRVRRGRSGICGGWPRTALRKPPAPRLDPARRGAGRPVRAGAKEPSRSRICRRTTSASPRAWARPRRSRRWRCRRVQGRAARRARSRVLPRVQRPGEVAARRTAAGGGA